MVKKLFFYAFPNQKFPIKNLFSRPKPDGSFYLFRFGFIYVLYLLFSKANMATNSTEIVIFYLHGVLTFVMSFRPKPHRNKDARVSLRRRESGAKTDDLLRMIPNHAPTIRRMHAFLQSFCADSDARDFSRESFLIQPPFKKKKIIQKIRSIVQTTAISNPQMTRMNRQSIAVSLNLEKDLTSFSSSKQTAAVR